MGDVSDQGTDLRITSAVCIPRSELEYRFTRSGGPGGQNVNRVSTQVELAFDVAGSPSLPEEARARLLAGLGHALDSRGVLHLTSQETRSQWRNREEVTARFVDVLREALRRRKPRRPTRPTAASRERRLAGKRQRGEIKRGRQRMGGGSAD